MDADRRVGHTGRTSRRGRISNAWIKYSIASAAVLVCSLVYEHFSHGVYSVFMLGAFLVPLLAGALPCFLSESLSRKKRSCETGRTAASGHKLTAADLQLAAVVTLTAGSLLKGALEIYGTGNSLMAVYPIAGIILAIAALCMAIKAPNTGFKPF